MSNVDFAAEASQLESKWAKNPRWNGVERTYTAQDVVRLRGSVKVEYSLAARGAARLWELLHSKEYVHTFGALTGAQAVQMVAVFWIETVEEVILVPPYHVGGPPFTLGAKRSVQGQRVPTFSVTPPHDLDMPRQLTVTFTQIQYTQAVLLNFAGLTWPHVSVNTLVPADDIIVPDSAWK